MASSLLSPANPSPPIPPPPFPSLAPLRIAISHTNAAEADGAADTPSLDGPRDCRLPVSTIQCSPHSTLSHFNFPPSHPPSFRSLLPCPACPPFLLCYFIPGYLSPLGSPPRPSAPLPPVPFPCPSPAPLPSPPLDLSLLPSPPSPSPLLPSLPSFRDCICRKESDRNEFVGKFHEKHRHWLASILRRKVSSTCQERRDGRRRRSGIGERERVMTKRRKR